MSKKTKEPFVKMRVSLKDNPKPKTIGRALVKPDPKLAGLGSIFIAWSLCLQFGNGNKLPGYTMADLDKETAKGFTQAAISVGWAIIHPDGIEFPGLDQWQESLKTYREQAAERMRNIRAENGNTVAQHVAQQLRTGSATASPPEVVLDSEVDVLPRGQNKNRTAAREPFKLQTPAKTPHSGEWHEKIIAAVKSFATVPLGANEEYELVRAIDGFCQQQPLIYGGASHPFPEAWLAGLKVMRDAGAAYGGIRSVTNYVRTILDRCLNTGLPPGEWPAKASEGKKGTGGGSAELRAVLARLEADPDYERKSLIGARKPGT